MVGVLEQHLQRAEAEGLVEHLVDEPFALHAVEQRVFGVAQALDDQADFAAQRVAVQVADPRQVELIDQLAVDQSLELLEARILRLVGTRRRSSRFQRWQGISSPTKGSHAPRISAGTSPRPFLRRNSVQEKIAYKLNYACRRRPCTGGAMIANEKRRDTDGPYSPRPWRGSRPGGDGKNIGTPCRAGISSCQSSPHEDKPRAGVYRLRLQAKRVGVSPGGHAGKSGPLRKRVGLRDAGQTVTARRLLVAAMGVARLRFESAHRTQCHYACHGGLERFAPL